MKDYRYPGERRTLWLTLGSVVLVVMFLSSFTLGGLALVVGLGLVFQMVRISMQIRAIRRSAAPVSFFPDVERIVDRCRQRLGLGVAVDVFVQDSRVLNAFAIGMVEPYVVVIHTGLIEALDEDELASVVGHELGHVMFGHTRLLGLIGQVGTQTLGGGMISALLRRLVFLFWMRASEFTADRAGLVACGDLHKALSTELKLVLSPSQWSSIDTHEVVRHFRANDVGIVERFGTLLATHPHAHARMDQLVDFHDSEVFAALS